MYHALVMGVLEGASGLQAYLNSPSPGKPVVPSKLSVQGVRDELHDDVGYVAFHLEVVDCGYIGVAESGS